MPIEEVNEFFARQADSRNDDLANEKLRSKLNKLPLYRSSKEDLSKQAKKLGIDNSGSKLDIAQRIVETKKIKLEGGPIYNGRLRSIPILSSSVRKLGKL